MTQKNDNREFRERIAKRMARTGLCSRRDAEKWIAAGRVVVDGIQLVSPAKLVGENSEILVDGQPLVEPEQPRLWRYYKPKGLITTHYDPQGRQTVFQVLPKELPRVISVGRLDLTSEGLLLLTNDGSLARRLEHPSGNWTRRYRVRVHGRVDPYSFESLSKGITIEGTNYKPITACLERQVNANAWINIELTEGKNREIRRVMNHLGWQVNRLIRVAYGPFFLRSLQPGGIEEVPTSHLARYRLLKTSVE